MYNASINEQQLSGSIQMLLIKSIIFFPFFVVFVERVWQQQCLNTLVSIFYSYCCRSHSQSFEPRDHLGYVVVDEG